MKKLLFFSSIIALMASCSSSYQSGELSGTQTRPAWSNEVPFGMLFIPQGSLNVGPSDQDVAWANTAQNRTVSVQAFWMDETEITNNEYRQFVDWVRDSLAYVTLKEDAGKEDLFVTVNEFGEDLDDDEQYIDWTKPIDWNEAETREALLSFFLQGDERFYKKHELDVRRLNFVFYWMDFKQAAEKKKVNGKENRAYNYKTGKYEGDVLRADGTRQAIKDRSSYIVKEEINIYPDTLCWVSDYTYSYNDPMSAMYFWHPAYDHYPVVGVSWKQAVAFGVWRTQLKNGYLRSVKKVIVNDYRLPSETEWEYAARGGKETYGKAQFAYYYAGADTENYKADKNDDLSPVGWYSYNSGGKPHEVMTKSPNALGIYDMSGNVWEWCWDKYNESVDASSPSDFAHNPLGPNTSPSSKRVGHGGSNESYAFNCGVALHYGFNTYNRSDDFGFRVVRTAR